jgi:hypothetical protein
MSIVATSPADLVRAWLALVALGLAASAIAALVGPPPVPRLAAAGVLALAWAKARLILARYLGLAAAPAWRRGFETVLALYALLLLRLFLVSAL